MYHKGMTVFFLIQNLIVVVFFGGIVAANYKRGHWKNVACMVSWALVACYGYEAFREIQRLLGETPHVGPYRLLLLKSEFFLLGMAFRQIIFYVESWYFEKHPEEIRK